MFWSTHTTSMVYPTVQSILGLCKEATDIPPPPPPPQDTWPPCVSGPTLNQHLVNVLLYKVCVTRQWCVWDWLGGAADISIPVSPGPGHYHCQRRISHCHCLYPQPCVCARSSVSRQTVHTVHIKLYILYARIIGLLIWIIGGFVDIQSGL